MRQSVFQFETGKQSLFRSKRRIGQILGNRKMEDGSFPKSLKLGGPPKDPNGFDSRAIAWIEDEVDQWIESRIEDRVAI